MEKRRDKHGKFFFISLGNYQHLNERLRGSFKDYFGGEKEDSADTERYRNDLIIKSDKFWKRIKRKVAKYSSFTHSEVNKMDVFDFFVNLSVIDEDIAEENRLKEEQNNKNGRR